MDADGLTEADADPDGLVLALADTEGLRELEGETDADDEAEALTEGDSDALTEALGELAAPGFVTSLSNRPSNEGNGAKGNAPVTASPMHAKETRRMLPILMCVTVTVPAIQRTLAIRRRSRE